MCCPVADHDATQNPNRALLEGLLNPGLVSLELLETLKNVITPITAWQDPDKHTKKVRTL